MYFEKFVSVAFRNIVCTVNLEIRLDLRRIARSARNAEYNPKRFAAVIMRIREPRTTALIFSSGKMVCTGAKSENEARLAARKYARIIQKLGFDVWFIFLGAWCHVFDCFMYPFKIIKLNRLLCFPNLGSVQRFYNSEHGRILWRAVPYPSGGPKCCTKEIYHVSSDPE